MVLQCMIAPMLWFGVNIFVSTCVLSVYIRYLAVRLDITKAFLMCLCFPLRVSLCPNTLVGPLSLSSGSNGSCFDMQDNVPPLILLPNL